MGNQEDTDLAFSVEIETIFDQISETQVVVFVKLLSGEVRADWFLEVENTGERWYVENLVHLSPEAYVKGLRGLLLKSIGHQSSLQTGMRLNT
jgi:hypothetical protein